jgi:hypothetical protein
MESPSRIRVLTVSMNATTRGAVIGASFLVTCFSAMAAHAAGPLRPFQLGLWSGGAWTNDQTGTFSHCAASAGYNSGIALLVMIDRSFGWGLGFTSQTWNLAPNTQFPVELRFDGGPIINLAAIALQTKLLAVKMPNNSRLINTFRFALQMTAAAQGQSALFNLTTTSKLLPQLGDCVRTSLALENGRPFGAPQAGADPRPPDTTANPTQDARLEETQLATNFLLAARLPGAQLLARADVPVQLASYGAVWRAEGAVGAVKIFPPQPRLTGLDLASQVIAGDAQSCKGKFASARYSELVDNDVVVRAVTSCSESEHQTEVQYFIAPHPKGGFVSFSVLGATTLDTQSVSSDQRIDVFKEAALFAVVKH